MKPETRLSLVVSKGWDVNGCGIPDGLLSIGIRVAKVVVLRPEETRYRQQIRRSL